MEPKTSFQRSVVLDAARALKNHPTPDEIYEYARERCPTISKGTVYRNISVLAREGFLRRIEVANAPDRVDYETEDHYHFLCESCGRVFDVEMPVFDDLEARIEDKKGFVFHGHDILFRGLCPECGAGH